MLVVPNRHTSVYTRLWCGYEAYLAFEGKKIIRTARRPILRPVAAAWMMMIPTAMLGVGIGYLINYQLWNLDIYLVTWCDCGVVMMVFYTEIGGVDLYMTCKAGMFPVFHYCSGILTELVCDKKKLCQYSFHVVLPLKPEAREGLQHSEKSSSTESAVRAGIERALIFI